MQTIRSADKTLIAYAASGAGPALVLVSGAFCDSASTAGLAARLSERFTVVRYDRRGRGASGDTAPYAVEREIEDLQAVIEAAGGQACVFGHSSGARLALDAAAAGVGVSQLAAYEPPVRLGPPGPAAATLRSRVEQLLARGDRRGAATLHLVESGTPEPVVQYMKAAPWWPGMEALAHTLPYDEALCGDLSVPTQALEAIAIPTLILAGADSDAGWRAALGMVADTISGAGYRELAGQTHVPADDVLAPVLARFFAEHVPSVD